jgi:spore coat polysaccharide biosynthesis protein SpsF
MLPGIFLSVREKATRFPGKVLKPLAGQTVTAFLIDRLKSSKQADTIVLTTSTDPRDDILCKIAQDKGVGSFCGSPEDKLLRYRDAARAFDLDYVVVVDGDDPFVSIEHIDRIIDFNELHEIDLTTCGDLPLGATGFGLRRTALESICDGRAEFDTEVWGGLFLENPDYVCATLEEPNTEFRRPDIRMTLDYVEDYEFFKKVVDGLVEQGKDMSFSSIMAYLRENPKILALNKDAQEKYELHLQASTPH